MSTSTSSTRLVERFKAHTPTPGSLPGAAPHTYFAIAEIATFRAKKAGAVPETRTEEMDISSRFGRRVRALRQERNLTQSEMAKRFGIDRSYISDLERGRKSISLPMLEVMAMGLQVSLASLVEGL